MESKRKNILDHLRSDNLHEDKSRDIISYITYNKIDHSINKNGLFINLSVLRDVHVNNIYNILFSDTYQVSNSNYTLHVSDNTSSDDEVNQSSPVNDSNCDNISLSNIDKYIIEESRTLTT